MGDNNSQKTTYKYCCIICDYQCSRKYDYDKHLSTYKHLNGDKMVTNGDIGIFYCECGKKYAYRQGLSRHKRTCKYNNIPTMSNDIVLLIEEQRKRDEEHKNQINRECFE